MRRIFFIILLSACGSVRSEPDSGFLFPPPPGDAGTLDAGPECDTVLWPVGATRARVTSRRGFPTVTCATDGGWIDGSTYELDLIDAGMRWDVCFGYPPNTTPHQGDMALTPAQLARFDAAMRGLVCATVRGAPADARERFIELQVDGGSVRYGEYRFSDQEANAYVSDEGVFSVLVTLDELIGLR
jgi:hypothetical protein